MDVRDKLKDLINQAWVDYVDLHKAEIESGYDDAMDGFERKEAEGYAMGLEAAYHLLYGETYTSELANEFDPYEFEESLNRE
jgi:hypothetical protein